MFILSIIDDGDFYYETKWARIKQDYFENDWLFDTRDEAKEAMAECYNEVINSFLSSKEHLTSKIKNKMVNFLPKFDLCLNKLRTVRFELNNGNQELYFTLAEYSEENKSIKYFNVIEIPHSDEYVWENIEELEDCQ